jgi:hypothetical protein
MPSWEAVLSVGLLIVGLMTASAIARRARADAGARADEEGKCGDEKDRALPRRALSSI